MANSKFVLQIFVAAFVCVGAVVGFVPGATSSAAVKKPVSFLSPSVLPKAHSSTQIWERKDDDDVQVNLIPDVDSVTLTAIGFGAIAFNFFVLANMGDGGIAGALATIINTFRQ